MAQQQHNAESKPTGFVATSLSLPDVREDMPTKCPDVKTQSSLISEVSALPQPVMNVFEPFIHERSVICLIPHRSRYQELRNPCC